MTTRSDGVEQQDASLVELLDRARQGSGDARDAVFTRCRNYVAVLARAEAESWLQAKVDASDLCQQTLLEAHRAFGDFRGRTTGEWLGWLRAILRHNAAELVRKYHGAAKRRVGREIPLEFDRSDASQPVGPVLQDGHAGPITLLVRHEEQLRLSDAIAQLPAEYQDVIVLRHVQRLPFDEVAQRLGKSRPAAQMLWLRAVRRLREELTRP